MSRQRQAIGVATIEEAADLRVIAVHERTDPAGIELVFDERSAEALKKFSAQAADHDVDFVIGGAKVATVKLRDPIIGNSAMLSGQFSSELTRACMAGRSAWT
jgi:hypothetical protein